MITSKPDFNRLATAVHYAEPDRLPLAELWVDAEVKATFLGDVSAAELDCREVGFNVAKDIEFWHKAGYDYIRLTPRYEFFQPWLKDTAAADFDEKLDVFVKSIDYSDVEKAEKLLPPGMKVIFAPEGGIFEQAWMNLGYEKFMTDLFENPEYIGRVCNVIGAGVLAMYQKICKSDYVGGFWFSDDIAYTEALIMSPAAIRKYLFPWYERFAQLAKANGKLFFYHSDGNQTPLLDDYIAMGFDAIHPIEPKAWDIAELKKRVHGRLALLGSVDMDYPLVRGTTAEIREYVKKRIIDIAPGGGFAIGSSNSVAKYVPVENYRAMLKAVVDFGQYPILKG
ncbi:MAG: uroporphyrinogen decarboxylase family protein [Candidatus Neomarinimicrobiota bacterium]